MSATPPAGGTPATPAPTPSPKPATKAALEAKVSSLETEKAALEAKVSSLETEKADLERKLEAANKAVATAKKNQSNMEWAAAGLGTFAVIVLIAALLVNYFKTETIDALQKQVNSPPAVDARRIADLQKRVDDLSVRASVAEEGLKLCQSKGQQPPASAPASAPNADPVGAPVAGSNVCNQSVIIGGGGQVKAAPSSVKKVVRPGVTHRQPDLMMSCKALSDGTLISKSTGKQIPRDEVVVAFSPKDIPSGMTCRQYLEQEVLKVADRVRSRP